MRKQTGKHISLTTIRRLIRQTKLKDAQWESTREIEVYWINACTQFKVVHNRA